MELSRCLQAGPFPHADRPVSPLPISLGFELIDRLGFAPVYFSAFVYIVLGMAINRTGQQYSVLTPKMVSPIPPPGDLLTISTSTPSSVPIWYHSSSKRSVVVKPPPEPQPAPPPRQPPTSWSPVSSSSSAPWRSLSGAVSTLPSGRRGTSRGRLGSGVWLLPRLLLRLCSLPHRPIPRRERRSRGRIRGSRQSWESGGR